MVVRRLMSLITCALSLWAITEPALAACSCDCVNSRNFVRFGHNNNDRNECIAACKFDETVAGEPLRPTGSCMAAPKPIYPIHVDWCAPIESRPANGFSQGNDTGLLGRRTGTSCIRISQATTKYRTWCHAWEENDPARHEGFCTGAFDTSSDCPGPEGKNVAYVQRQFGDINVVSGQYELCMHVENLEATRTLHFDMTGAPVD